MTTGARLPADAHADFARLLLHAHRAVEREMMGAAAATGLGMLRPGHMTVLRVLDPGPGGIRISEMARDAGVSRQAIQQIVADLEELGIVESFPDEDDGRARRVRYTRSGRRGYEECMRQFTRIEGEIEAELGPRQMKQLKRALTSLAARSPT